MREGVVPTDGMVITESIRFAPGVYAVPSGITIGADGVTVEGDGTLLVSAKQEGVGIAAQGRSGISIRNLAISGFYHGIRADDCRDVTVEGVKVRDTWEIPGIDTFLYLWQAIDKVYGGALLFHHVEGGSVRACDFQHQLNGVLLYGCSRITVDRVNASFNSGWGVYLFATSDSVVTDNRLDFCNRLFQRDDGSVRAEADAAGIILVRGSSRNRFLRNSCVGGGDGIYASGYDFLGVHEPCNDNLFEDNDCRLSPNNAIEANFSQGNIFRRNNCSRSNYGFWLGYSWDNVVEDNEVEFNRWVGLAAEHARGFVIRNNRIRLNGEGVRLWTRGGGVLPHFPGWEVGHHMTLEDNLFESNRIGVNLYTGPETTGHELHHLILRNNTFKDNRIGAQMERVRESVIEGNTFDENVVAAVRLLGEPGVSLGQNMFSGNAAETVRAEGGQKA